MWTYLDKLYSSGSNLSRAYDVIQELFRNKQESWTLAQFYADFIEFSTKVKEIFPITTNVKKMQERWNKLMVLVFLGALHSEFSKAPPNVIDSSTVKSLEDSYYLRKTVGTQNPAIVETQDHSALVFSKAEHVEVEAVG